MYLKLKNDNAKTMHYYFRNIGVVTDLIATYCHAAFTLITWQNSLFVVRYHVDVITWKHFPRNCTIIITWRGITCRTAVTFEGVENAYLPGNVHFQYRPYAILEMLHADWMSASRDAHCLVGFSLKSARKRERICRHDRDLQTVSGIKFTLFTGLNRTQKAYKTMIHREIKWS